MAETTKLSVGKVLDKMRKTDVVQKTKMTRLNDKIDELDKEINIMKATRYRLETDQRGKSTKRD